MLLNVLHFAKGEALINSQKLHRSLFFLSVDHRSSCRFSTCHTCHWFSMFWNQEGCTCLERFLSVIFLRFLPTTRNNNTRKIPTIGEDKVWNFQVQELWQHGHSNCCNKMKLINCAERTFSN